MEIYPFLTASLEIYPFLTAKLEIYPFLTASLEINPFLTANLEIYPFLTAKLCLRDSLNLYACSEIILGSVVQPCFPVDAFFVRPPFPLWCVNYAFAKICNCCLVNTF